MDTTLHRLLASSGIAALMNFIVGHYVTIYMIHRPQPLDGAYEGLTPALLEESIVYAKNAGFEFASIDEVLADAIAGRKPKRPTICFTLDDGYQDQIDQLVPVLLAHNCKPTLFTIVDMIDGILWPWDAKLSHATWTSTQNQASFQFNKTVFNLALDHTAARIHSRRQLTRFGKTLKPAQLHEFIQVALAALAFDPDASIPASYRPASWDSLRHAEQQGLRIGSHACSHQVFAVLSDAQINAELERANIRLAQELKSPSRVFCYPSGTINDYSSHHIQLVKAQGFIGALTSTSGNTNLKQIQTQPFEIKRHSFPNNFEKFVRYSSWLEYIRSSIE
jgi:peptidoglycan/xylan/chitin deacetylase (PgdA/CDA1 family)